MTGINKRSDFYFILTIVALVQLMILNGYKPKLRPYLLDNETKKITKRALKIVRMINEDLGITNGKTRNPYLKHSDDKNSTKLSETSYKVNVKDELDKLDKIETDVQGSKLDLSDLKLPTKRNSTFMGSTDIKPLTLKGSEIKRFIKSHRKQRVRYQDFTPTLHNSRVSVQMDLPQGIQISKIDQIHNVYYGFRTRVSLAYVNSFYDHLSDFEMQNPHLSFPMTRDSMTLTAKVTFDKLGNIQKIKMVRWSDSPAIQQFFTKVIDGIQSVPNPPKDFVKNDTTFTIYYTLKLN
jgi:hypothetical protein